jgi:hypothetical protein
MALSRNGGKWTGDSLNFNKRGIKDALKRDKRGIKQGIL